MFLDHFKIVTDNFQLYVKPSKNLFYLTLLNYLAKRTTEFKHKMGKSKQAVFNRSLNSWIIDVSVLQIVFGKAIKLTLVLSIEAVSF